MWLHVMVRGRCCVLLELVDESQCEVSKKLVKFKTFPDKESAAKFKEQVEAETGKRWSDVGHYGDKYYVGYCRAGELAVESVLAAGKYYRLNVDLTAGYMLGNSWKTCH